MFCIKIWSKSSPPYMQLLHFCFAVGAFLAPLLARPFLGDGALATNNTAYSIPIPVNTHLPVGSIGTDSNAGRVTRDAALWWLTDSRHSRYVRDVDNPDGGIDESGTANLTGSFNETGNITDSFNGTALLSSTTLKPTTARPKKPIAADAGHLDPQHASGDKIKDELAKHVDDQRVDDKKPEEHDANVITTTTGSFCTVYENVTVTNSTDNSTVVETVEKQVPCPTVAAPAATVGQETSLNNATRSPPVNESKTTVPQSVSSTQFIPGSPIPSTTLAVVSTTPVITTTTSTTTTTTPKPTTTTPQPTTTHPSSTTTAKPAPPHGPGSGDNDDTGAQDSGSPDENADNKNTPEDNSKDNASGQESAVEGNATSGPFTTTTPTTTTRKPKPQSTLDSLVNGALDAVRNMSRIQFAYLFVGLFLLGDAIYFLVLYCRDCRAGMLLHQVLALGPSMAPAAPCFRVSILTLLFSFFLVYVGMEVTFGGLVTTFAVDSDLQWSRAQGATLAALFWGSIATGRGLSIFIARCFKPPCMLVTDLVLVLTGGVMLSLGLKASPVILWVGTVVLGLGMSSVFPTAISWADCYYPLTGRATAVFIAGSGVGEMVIPVLTGYLFETVSSMWLMYVVLALGGMLTVVYTCLQCIASRNPAPVSASKLGFMPLQNEDEATDNNSIALHSMDTEDVVNGSAGYTETVMHRRKPPVSNHTAIDVEETAKLVDLSD